MSSNTPANQQYQHHGQPPLPFTGFDAMLLVVPAIAVMAVGIAIRKLTRQAS